MAYNVTGNWRFAVA